MWEEEKYQRNGEKITIVLTVPAEKTGVIRPTLIIFAQVDCILENMEKKMLMQLKGCCLGWDRWDP